MLDLFDAVFRFIAKAIKWFCDLSLKGKILFVIIVLLPILWWKIPNPRSVQIEPLLNQKTQNTTSYVANVSEVEVSFSLGSEVIGQLSSLSKHSNAFELINTTSSLLEQNEKLKGTTKNFAVPFGAGKDSFSGVTIYAWKKSYRRFFTKDTPENLLFEYNLITVHNNDIMYFKGGRNDYFSLSATAYIGAIKK